MADKKVELSNTLALFNLIRILEDWCISKWFGFSILLLPVDVVVLGAVIISRFERWVAYSVVGGFMRYLQYDLRILKELVLMILQKEYVSEELTRDPTEGEREFTGKAFKRTQLVLRFLWSLVIFLVSFPLLPILWLWEYLARAVLIGYMYYLILFFNLPLLIVAFLFSVATFMVSISTVPWLFGVFVYFKSLFELESRSFKEIKAEADTLFVRLYRYHFDEHEEEEDDEHPRGGIYYLFLKALHGAKDHTFGILRWVSKRRTTNEILEKLKLEKVRDQIVRQMEERRPISPGELMVPLFAFLITFGAAVVMVFAGTKGEGIIGSFMVSMIDSSAADRIWFSFQGGMGYIEHYLVLAPFFSGLLGGLGFLVDQLFGYLFIVWHGFMPFYFQFVVFYYASIGRGMINFVR